VVAHAFNHSTLEEDVVRFLRSRPAYSTEVVPAQPRLHREPCLEKPKPNQTKPNQTKPNQTRPDQTKTKQNKTKQNKTKQKTKKKEKKTNKYLFETVSSKILPNINKNHLGQ
jgi:chromatin segregation and condensation protein Rec8/ScpA/Scc1 (kleisin family)